MRVTRRAKRGAVRIDRRIRRVGLLGRCVLLFGTAFIVGLVFNAGVRWGVWLQAREGVYLMVREISRALGTPWS